MTISNQTTAAQFEDEALTIKAGNLEITLSTKDIEHHWNNLSHFPERRARIELRDLAARINKMAGYIHATASQSGNLDTDSETEEFCRRHLERTRRYWAMESRCASWFITGSANFPVARNEKRMCSSMKAAEHVSSHLESAKRGIERRAWPHGAPNAAIRGSNPDAPALLRQKIDELEASQETMKAANAAIRKAKGKGIEEMAQAVVDATGLKHSVALEICSPSHFGGLGFARFSLTNNLATLKRYKDRLAIVEAKRERGEQQKEIETTGGKIQIVENPEADRIQIIFKGKPEEATRQILKKNGFRWSPSNGAWQRHLNNAGRFAVKNVVQNLA